MLMIDLSSICNVIDIVDVEGQAKLHMQSMTDMDVSSLLLKYQLAPMETMTVDKQKKDKNVVQVHITALDRSSP